MFQGIQAGVGGSKGCSLLVGERMPVSIEKARMFLEKKEHEKRTVLDALYQRACRDFNAIKEMIIERYQPRRIYQWGSLLDRSRFREYSDIDIAVEGVDDAEHFFKMYGDAERLTDFPLDLLDLNRIEPEFAAGIRQRGVRVYERADQ